MADGSSTKAMDCLAGLAYLAVTLLSSAGYLVTTRLLTGDPRDPRVRLGDAACIGATCSWLLIVTPAPALMRLQRPDVSQGRAAEGFQVVPALQR